MNSEILARLNPSPITYGTVRGGKPTITREEVAAALSCATNARKCRMLTMMAYALYMEDENAKDDLKNYLLFCHIDDGYRTNKKDKGQDRMRKVCAMAVQAFCMRGTDGDLSGNQIAERLSIPKSTWHNKWGAWFRKSITLLNDLESLLDRHISRRL